MSKLKYFTFIVLLVAFFCVGLGVANVTWADSSSGFFGSTDDVCAYWKSIFDFGIKIAGALAMLMMTFAGLLWMISEGKTDKITRAKDYFKGALTGLFLAMVSYIGFSALNPYILECKIEIIDMRGVKADSGVSVCKGAKKTYTSQTECEKAEASCTKGKTSCVKDETITSDASCKGSSAAVTDKSECCSGKTKYLSGMHPVLVCDGGKANPSQPAKQWCCKQASSQCAKDLVAKARTYSGTCFGPCHCAWFVSNAMKDAGCGNGTILSVSGLEGWLKSNGWTRHDGKSGVQAGDIVATDGHIGIHVGGGKSINSSTAGYPCVKECPDKGKDAKGTNKCASCEKISSEGPSTGRFISSGCFSNQCVKETNMKFNRYWRKD